MATFHTYFNVDIMINLLNLIRVPREECSNVITIGVILLLDLPNPAEVSLQHLPAGVVVVIIDVHPGLDAEAGVSHPVVIVTPARGGVVRGLKGAKNKEKCSVKLDLLPPQHRSPPH